MTDCKQFLPDLCAWIDGELEDSAALEAHLAECASCRALAAQYRQLDTMLAAVEPPSGLHEHIMQGVSAACAPKRRFVFGSATAVAAVAAVLLLAIGMGWIRAPRMKSADTAAAEAATESAVYNETMRVPSGATEDTAKDTDIAAAAEPFALYAEEAPAEAVEVPAAKAEEVVVTEESPDEAPKMAAAKPTASEPVEKGAVADRTSVANSPAKTAEEAADGTAPEAVMQSGKASAEEADVSACWLLTQSLPDTLPDAFASLQFTWGEVGVPGCPVWSAETDEAGFRALLDACGDLSGSVIGDGAPYRIILLPDADAGQLIWHIHAEAAQLPVGMQASLCFEADADGVLCAETDPVTLWALYLCWQDALHGETQWSSSSVGARIVLEP